MNELARMTYGCILGRLSRHWLVGRLGWREEDDARKSNIGARMPMTASEGREGKACTRLLLLFVVVVGCDVG